MASQAGITSIPDWTQYGNNAVSVYVELSGLSSNPPAITANLVCDSRPQPPTAGIRVMNPSQAGFTAYLQLADGSDLDVATAQSYNWRVAYIAQDF